jgi:hypothetical protein
MNTPIVLAGLAVITARRCDLQANRIEALEDTVAELARQIARLEGESRLQFGMLLNLDKRVARYVTSTIGWMCTGAARPAIRAMHAIPNAVRPGSDSGAYGPGSESAPTGDSPASRGVTLDLGGS